MGDGQAVSIKSKRFRSPPISIDASITRARRLYFSIKNSHAKYRAHS
jgi:hypothetical protein